MKVAVIPNQNKDSDLTVTRSAVSFLLSLGAEIYSDTPVNEKAVFADTETCVKAADIVLTVGGDGTILHTARFSAAGKKPTLGINMGKVGFMADVEPCELDLLAHLFSGDYTTENRMLLSCDVVRGGDTIFSSLALNDVVISKGTVSRMIEFDILSDGNFIHSYHADGVIFATPTGSTAYSLSAGGPIVSPDLNCILATPVCVHSIKAARPVIFNDNAAISVKINTLNDNPAFVTSDGIENFRLEHNDTVYIRKSELTFQLIRIKKESFYTILSKKIQ